MLERKCPFTNVQFLECSNSLCFVQVSVYIFSSAVLDLLPLSVLFFFRAEVHKLLKMFRMCKQGVLGGGSFSALCKSNLLEVEEHKVIDK